MESLLSAAIAIAASSLTKKLGEFSEQLVESYQRLLELLKDKNPDISENKSP